MSLYDLDVSIFRAIYGIDGPVVLWASTIFTHLATKGSGPILAALGFLAFGRGTSRRVGAALAVGLIAHLAIIEGAIKHLIARTRPFTTLGVELRDTLLKGDSYSCPSGHSTASFLCAWIISARYPRLRIPLFVLAALVALSRVNLGAHYPSDVTFGAILGIGMGAALVRAFRIDAAAEPPAGAAEPAPAAPLPPPSAG